MTYLTYADIAKMTGLSPEALRVRRHRGQMPPPDVNVRQPLWKPETIQAWMEDKEDER